MMNFQKILKKKCSKFQNFRRLSTGKVIKTKKCTQAAWTPFLSILTYLSASGCHNFRTGSQFTEILRVILSHAFLSSGNIPSKSEMGHVPVSESLVHLTWNEKGKQTLKIMQLSLKNGIIHIRPWHDEWTIAHTCTVTHANQEEGGLGRGWKACSKVNLHGLISFAPSAK